MKADAHLQLMKWAEMFGSTFLFSVLCSLLMLGKLLLHLVQKHHIPPAVIGGLIGLFLLTMVGHLDSAFGDDITQGLEVLKKNLVNFVFAALILGLSCSRSNSHHSSVRGIITSILHEGMPMIIYNQILTWGMSTICLALMCVYNHYDPSIPPLFAAMIPLGLEAGLEINPTRLYQHFWSTTVVEEAESLGLMCTAVMGIYLIVYKTYFLKKMGDPNSSHSMPVQMESFDRYLEAKHNKEGNYHLQHSVSASSLNTLLKEENTKENASKPSQEFTSLGVHISFVAISVFLAFGIKFISKIIEIETNLDHLQPFGGVRMFKLSMCCALFSMHFALRNSSIRFRREWFMRLCGLSLDIIVIAALSKSYPKPHHLEKTHYLFCSLFVLACLLLNFLCFKYIARYMFPNFWYERGLVLSADALGHSYMVLFSHSTFSLSSFKVYRVFWWLVLSIPR